MVRGIPVGEYCSCHRVSFSDAPMAELGIVSSGFHQYGSNTVGLSLRLFAAAACLTLLGPGIAVARNITGQDWGTARSGEKVSLFTLKGGRGLEARITNYGGRIVSLIVPNKQGGVTDVQLGYDDFAAYEKAGDFYGALVGRYVGRISHGGSFPLNGKTVQLEKSDPN